MSQRQVEQQEFAVGADFNAYDDLRAGRLVTVLQDFRAPRIYLSLVYAPSRNISVKIRLFVKFIQQWFALSEF